MTNGDMEGPFDKCGKTTEAFISPFPPIFQFVKVISFPLVAEDAYLFIVANNVFCVHSILVEVEWTQIPRFAGQRRIFYCTLYLYMI